MHGSHGESASDAKLSDDDARHRIGYLHELLHPAARRRLEQNQQAQADHQRRQHDRNVEDRIDQTPAGKRVAGQKITERNSHQQRQDRA